VLDALADIELDGLVLAGFGGGHLPEQVARSEGLRRLLDRIPVVLTSRAGAGEPLTRTYGGFDGSETSLLNRGLITSGRLDGPKSKVLLTLLLALGSNRDAMRATFANLGK
jgi:L-asparaginase